MLFFINVGIIWMCVHFHCAIFVIINVQNKVIIQFLFRILITRPQWSIVRWSNVRVPMMSVGSNILCRRPHGADPLPHASTWALPLPSPRGHHKWMAPKQVDRLQPGTHYRKATRKKEIVSLFDIKQLITKKLIILTYLLTVFTNCAISALTHCLCYFHSYPRLCHQ